MKLLLAILLSTFSLSALASDAKAEAEELLSLMNMEQVLEQSIEQSLDAQIQMNPMLATYKNVMMNFLEKHMSYASLKDDLVSLYASNFTASELKDLNDFYKTPTGQKTIQVLPQLMQQGAQLGMNRVQQNIGELQQMIQEAMAAEGQAPNQ